MTTLKKHLEGKRVQGDTKFKDNQKRLEEFGHKYHTGDKRKMTENDKMKIRDLQRHQRGITMNQV